MGFFALSHRRFFFKVLLFRFSLSLAVLHPFHRTKLLRSRTQEEASVMEPLFPSAMQLGIFDDGTSSSRYMKVRCILSPHDGNRSQTEG